MSPISRPAVSGRTLRRVRPLHFLLLFLLCCPFCLGCMSVCRIALTPSSSVCQSTQCLSFVHHVTFAECLSRRWKSHLTPFKVELRLQSCDRSTICALPHGLGLPPHFTASDTLTEIKLPKCRPLAGNPSESANDPVCLRKNLLFCSCVCPPSDSVLTLQWLLSHLCPTCATLTALRSKDGWTFTVGQCLWWENSAGLVLQGTDGADTCRLAGDTGVDMSVSTSHSVDFCFNTC